MSACTQIRHLQAIGLVAMAGLAGCSKGEEVSVPLQVAEAKLDSVSSFEPHISGFEGFLAYPFALDTDEEGNIYVLDLRERRIVVLDPAFQVLRIIGREGQGPGEFESMTLQ